MLKFFSKKTKGFTPTPQRGQPLRGGKTDEVSPCLVWGFTLIELLVVIAIIGLLTAFSLIVIARYRNKAKDARIESVLTQVRQFATMIYHDNESYQLLCDTGDNDTLNDQGSGGLKESIKKALSSIEADVKKFSGSDPKCYATGESYCVKASLVSGDGGKGFCVDSTGRAGSSLTDCDRDPPVVCE